jgi:hypothetical protein
MLLRRGLVALLRGQQGQPSLGNMLATGITDRAERIASASDSAISQRSWDPVIRSTSAITIDSLPDE